MEPQHTENLLKHLDKQQELLKEAHKNMSEELQKLQVEEQMMMRKLYELLTAQRLNKKKTEETQNQEIVEFSCPPTATTGDEEPQI